MSKLWKRDRNAGQFFNASKIAVRNKLQAQLDENTWFETMINCSQTKFVAIVLVLWSFLCDFLIDRFFIWTIWLFVLKNGINKYPPPPPHVNSHPTPPPMSTHPHSAPHVHSHPPLTHNASISPKLGNYRRQPLPGVWEQFVCRELVMFYWSVLLNQRKVFVEILQWYLFLECTCKSNFLFAL